MRGIFLPLAAFLLFSSTVSALSESQYSLKATVLYLSCPRIAYADATEVTVLCLEEGVACKPEEIDLDGAYAEFVTQSGQAFVYRAEMRIPRVYKLSVSHPGLATASCDVLRADTSPVATVPEFNLWMLPILALAVLSLLRKAKGN